jgi:hypothetical protein
MSETTLNDRYLSVLSVCNRCKHFDVFDYTCPAFPEGIPDELLAGKAQHNEVLKGQTGDTIFEER